MRDHPHPRAATFLDALESALGGPGLRSAEVLAEVESDLEAAVADLMAAGAHEDAAWTRALEDLGDPQELAAAMRGPLPPELPDRWMLHARRAAAILMGGWFALIAWSVRSWDWGDRFGLFFFVAGLGLAPTLLLWPGIVWRWNALFSTANAIALVVLGAFLLNAGSHSAVTYELGAVAVEQPLLVEDATALEPQEPDEPLLEREHLAALAALAAAGLVLSLVQQRAQRRRIVLGAAGLMLLLDLPFTIEEQLFAREARAVEAWAEDARERTGSWPSQEQFAAEYQPLLLSKLRYSTRSDTWSLSWARALQGTAGVGYHSDRGFWGND